MQYYSRKVLVRYRPSILLLVLSCRIFSLSVSDGMTVDPLWDSIVTSGNLPVRKLRRSLGATRDTKSGTNDHYDES